MAFYIQPQTHLLPKPGPQPTLRLHILLLGPHTHWPRQSSAFVQLDSPMNVKHQSPAQGSPSEHFPLRKSHWVSEVGVRHRGQRKKMEISLCKEKINFLKDFS